MTSLSATLDSGSYHAHEESSPVVATLPALGATPTTTTTATRPPMAPRSANATMNTNLDDQQVLASSFDEEDEEEEDDEAVKPWDEGGPSDCGYSVSVHDMLMSVGAKVHAVVGAPSQKVRTAQESIGNWFQELSYAARDILRGENTAEMHEDAADAMSTLFTTVAQGEDVTAITTMEEKKTEDVVENYVVADKVFT